MYLRGGNTIKDLTKGAVPKTLILFALPILGGRLLNTAYNIVDTIFVGRLGHEAIGAVSLSFNVIFVVIALAAGLTMGTTILIAQYVGAGDKDMVNKVVINSIFFIGIIAATLALVGFIISPYILKLMGTPSDIYSLSLSYMRIIFVGIIWMFGYFLVSSILRGIGDSKTPLKFLFVSTVINIALDPILIFGLGPIPMLGVSGAALATVIAQGVAAVLGFHYLFNKEKYLEISFKNFSFDYQIIKDILRLGLPSGIAQTLMALGGTVVMATIADFGSLAVATYGIGMKVDSLAFIVIQSLAMAVSTMIGQNIGAGLNHRVAQIVKSSLILASAIMASYTLIYYFIPDVLVKIFTNEAGMIEPTVLYIRIVSLSYVFFGIMSVLNAVIRGAGAMFQSMLITVVNLWIIRVPLAKFLSIDSGPKGIWLALSISYAAGSALSYLYYRYGDWKSKAVVSKKETHSEQLT